MKSAASLLAVALLLAACASQPTTTVVAGPPAAEGDPPPAAATAPSRAAKPADKRLAQAVIAPLADLNLVREEIPVALMAALQAPYGPTPDGTCETLAVEVEALEAELGDDLDAPGQDPQTLFERGADAAADAVIGAVHSATTGALPFRSWLRKITGAERHARQFAAAIEAGKIRRAYLKGLGHASGCLPPAAPQRDAP